MPSLGASALSDGQLRDWERWSAQLLETHISYRQLACYRSQHSNQSWLGALTAILDSSAFILAGLDALPARQAQLTFATARHALVDVTQIFVPRYSPDASNRLLPEKLGERRARLADTPMKLLVSAEFEKRLTALRRMYEPYAPALATHLLCELPPWIHAKVRRDNWRGGPSDKALAVRPGSEHRSDEHS